MTKKHLSKLFKFDELLPEAWNAFKALDAAAICEGEISLKTRN